MRRTLMLEIIGWYGAVAVLLAYALISFSLVSSTHWLFQVLNLSGAICLAGVAYSKKGLFVSGAECCVVFDWSFYLSG